MDKEKLVIVPQNTSKTTPFTTYQIMLLLAFTLILFTVVVDYMLLPALSAVLLSKLEITTKEFGLVISVYGFCAAISSLLAVSFADSFDRKKLLQWYYGGFLIGLFLCAMSNSLTTLLIARGITGIAGGVVASICFAIVADLFETDQRGRVMGFIQMAFAISHIIGLPFALYLATNFDWHFAYWSFFIFGLLLLTFIFFKVKPIKEHLQVQRKAPLWKPFLIMIRTPAYWTVFLNNMLLVLGDIMFTTFISAYSTNNLGVSLEDLPLLFGISGVATIVLSPIVGRFSDRLGKWRVFIFGSLLVIGMIVVYTRLGKVPFWLVAIIHTLIFIGINIRMITAAALTTMVPEPTDRGAFMTLDASFQQLAGGIAATIAGLIVYQSTDGVINGYPLLGWVVIGIVGLTLGLIFLIHHRIKKRASTQV